MNKCDVCKNDRTETVTRAWKERPVYICAECLAQAEAPGYVMGRGTKLRLAVATRKRCKVGPDVQLMLWEGVYAK